MLGPKNLPRCAIDGSHTSRPLRFCETRVVIHWQKSIEGLGMMLASEKAYWEQKRWKADIPDWYDRPVEVAIP